MLSLGLTLCELPSATRGIISDISPETLEGDIKPCKDTICCFLDEEKNLEEFDRGSRLEDQKHSALYLLYDIIDKACSCLQRRAHK